MAQTRPFFDPAKLPVVYHPGETLDEKLQESEGICHEGFQTRKDYYSSLKRQEFHNP